jgi:PAS domain S-box-containing protein
MAQLMREHNWAKTALGSVETWDQSLKTAVGLMLRSAFPQFIAWGPERIFLYNDAYRPILGSEKHRNALGARFENVWADIWPDLSPIVDKVFAGGSSYFEDLPLYMNRSGYFEQTYFTFSYSPFLDDQGAVRGLFCSCVETTARKTAEDALRLSEKERTRTIETIPQGIWRTYPNGAADYFSERLYQLVGYGAEEMLGWGWSEIIFEEDRPRIIAEWSRCREAKTGVSADFRVKMKDGSLRWFLSIGNPFFDSNGELIWYYGTWTDIHNERLARNQLETMREALENSLNGFDIVGADGRFQYVNKAYLRMWGYDSAAEVIGTSSAAHCANPEVPMQIITALKANGECNIEFKALRKDGSTFDVNMWARLAHDADGNEIYPTTSIDVTARKQYEEELHAAKDEAERANQLKSAFLANMSHEIRTPLGAMIGFADLLRDQGLTATERSNYIDILARNGENLSVIINDILDLSKVEAGHLTLEFAEAHPNRIAEEVISLLRVKAKEKSLALEYSFDAGTPETIISDSVRIRQVLTNLIGNAVKFTPFGSVKVRGYGCTTESGLPAVCFEITDTGIGIPASEHDRVFEMFVQADGSMTRRFGGTGLGLALSRKLAWALGGDLRISRSEEGKGTTFLFMVEHQPERRNTESVASIEVRPAQDLPPDILKGVRVLVVDDAPDNQQLIWRYLTKRGAIVESAENGYEGYKKAIAGTFDVVLMDIQMPLMDGYTATQKLRGAGFSKPIIALTAHAMTEVRRRCLNVGCSDHLTKPLDPKALVSTIARLTQKGTSPGVS